MQADSNSWILLLLASILILPPVDEEENLLLCQVVGFHPFLYGLDEDPVKAVPHAPPSVGPLAPQIHLHHPPQLCPPNPVVRLLNGNVVDDRLILGS